MGREAGHGLKPDGDPIPPTMAKNAGQPLPKHPLRLEARHIPVEEAVFSTCRAGRMAMARYT